MRTNPVTGHTFEPLSQFEADGVSITLGLNHHPIGTPNAAITLVTATNTLNVELTGADLAKAAAALVDFVFKAKTHGR